jgi:predicted pyridoxine 5'-phosphate oxidase superfamily flavin-nucleotide-binding protein
MVSGGRRDHRSLAYAVSGGQALVITDEASLRRLHLPPMHRATDKVLRGLDQHCRRIISLSPFCIVATQGPEPVLSSHGYHF